MSRLPSVKNVNKGKRHKKKHYFKVGDPVVFKWYAERDFGYISELTFEKGTKNAQYSVNATGRVGCIYHTMELDDPDDPYCYISSVLTKSITENELKKIDDHKTGRHLIVQSKIKVVETPKPTKKSVESVNKSELKRAINKQKKFLRGEVNKSFW